MCDQLKTVLGGPGCECCKQRDIDLSNEFSAAHHVLRNLFPKGETMHYRNGREAKNGDKVIKLGIEGGKIEAVGVLHDAQPGNDYCNGSIAPVLTEVRGACMCDCLHADDLAAILKEKGLDKRPSGK